MTQIEQARHILRLIETVTPDDTEMLDEIDARFWCLLNGHKFKRMLNKPYRNQDAPYSFYKSNGEWDKRVVSGTIQFTRSFDACQAAMPEGWGIIEMGFMKDGRAYCVLCNEDGAYISSAEEHSLPLAFLSAIIEAMIWAMENNNATD